MTKDDANSSSSKLFQKKEEKSTPANVRPKSELSSTCFLNGGVFAVVIVCFAKIKNIEGALSKQWAMSREKSYHRMRASWHTIVLKMEKNNVTSVFTACNYKRLMISRA